MYMLLFFLCISLEYIQFTKGQAKGFKGVFYKGDVKFTWTPDSHISEKIAVYLPTAVKGWMNVTDRGTYTQKDILNYTRIEIIVLSRFNNGTRSIYSERFVFQIPKVTKAESGKDKEIEIPLEFIPPTGGYSVKNDDKNVVLFDVEGDSVSSKDISKYIYVSKSDSKPKSITIKIKNATTEDAGYISTTAGKSNQNGPGVVLVVTGSPSKPNIAGNVNVPVGEDVTLTCESKSTSAPSYYKMLPPLTYTWYRNETKIAEWTPNQWRFRVEKRHKYDNITCMSREEIVSVRSNSFRLNPQYLSEPVLYTENGIMTTSTFGENVNLNLSCNVEGSQRPEVSILRDRNTLSTGNEWSNYTFSKGLQCEDTGNYTCAGKISMLEPKNKSFLINVLCSTRIDVANSPRSLYGSVIGQVARVIFPVISNPKPDMPTWKKPGNADIQTKIIQGSVVYRYVIENKIHVKEETDFGNYTALVGDRELIIVTIKALLPPINVTGMAISATAIRLTWGANDDSAPVTKYVIYQLFEASWEIIANARAESNKKIFSYVVNQRLRPDRSYSFGIQSCNTDICSTSQKLLGIYTLGISSSSTVTSLNTTGVVGIILGVLLVICLAVAIVVWNLCRSRRACEKGIRQEIQVNAAKDEGAIDNQRLPAEHFPDHNEYDFIDEGINSQNNQTESSMVPKTEQYQDVLGVIKADGTGQENLQMVQYGNEGGCVGKTFTSETVDNGENEYESTCSNDDQSGRLYTALSSDDEPQGKLYTDLSRDDEPQSSLYTALHPDHQPRSSVYTSLRPNDKKKESLYTSLR